MTAQPRSMTTTVDRVDEAEVARPMRADAKRNYERLVTAAREVFAQEGGGASMEAIAKEAGVGIGTLYRHFPKRIDVVEAVYREDVDELTTVAESVTATMEPWPALVAWLEAFVRYASGKKRFLNELHEAFEKNPELRVASRERIVGALGLVLTPAQEAGVVRTRYRRARPDAAAQLHVHERDPDAGSERAVARHDRGRPPAAPVGRQPLRGSDTGVLGAHRIGVRHMRHQRVRRDRSQPTCFEILEGLRDLAAGVHHEGPVVLHRLPDGLAPEDQDLEVARSRNPARRRPGAR